MYCEVAEYNNPAFQQDHPGGYLPANAIYWDDSIRSMEARNLGSTFKFFYHKITHEEAASGPEAEINISMLFEVCSFRGDVSLP